MALTVNDSINTSAPKPLDNKYGIFTSGAFRAYANIAEANSTIATLSRSVGLTVLINTGSGNQEYWYQGGTADINLVAKASVVTTTSPLTFTSNSVGIQVASGSQAGAISAADWNTFNTKVSSVATTGSGAVNIYAGTSGGAVTIKSLSGAGGVTLGDTGGTITITSVLPSGANLGSGAQLYTITTAGALQIRTLTVTGGLTVTTNTNDIAIGISGQQIPTPSTTASATPTVIATATIPDATAGILVVTMVGIVSGLASSMTAAQRFVRYYKASGILNIIDGVFDIIPEAVNTFTTTSWTIVVNVSNNFDVQVTGQASTNIKWAATIKNYSNS